MAPLDHDQARMRRAAALARMGRFTVEPNPIVGCVIEGPDGAGVVGEGWHKAYGGPHAEIEALRVAGGAARGATVYVTLEPCSHQGKTPPCADALVEAGVRRVVYGCVDPNPAVAGRGLKRLEQAGVELDGPVLLDETKRLLDRFRAALSQRRPWVIAKWAMSLDGAIAPKPGPSGPISGRRARLLTHALRARVDAVCVGIGTVLADDPLLTCRLEDGPPDGRAQPTRVVLDTDLRMPITSRLVADVETSAVIVFGADDASPDKQAALEAVGVRVERAARRDDGLDLRATLERMQTLGMQRVLVEGGSRVHGSMFRHGVVDQANVYVAPLMLGGRDAVRAVSGTGIDDVRQALRLDEVMWKKVGDDLQLQGYVPGEPGG